MIKYNVIADMVEQYYSKLIVNTLGNDDIYDYKTVIHAVDNYVKTPSDVAVFTEDLFDFYYNKIKQNDIEPFIFKYIPRYVIDHTKREYFSDKTNWSYVRQAIHNAKYICETLNIDYNLELEYCVFIRMCENWSSFSVFDPLVKSHLETLDPYILSIIAENAEVSYYDEEKSFLGKLILASVTAPPADTLDRFKVMRVHYIMKRDDLSRPKAMLKCLAKYKDFRKPETKEYNPIWYEVYKSRKLKEIDIIKKYVAEHLKTDKLWFWYAPIMETIKKKMNVDNNKLSVVEDYMRALKTILRFNDLSYNPEYELFFLSKVLSDNDFETLKLSKYSKNIIKIDEDILKKLMLRRSCIEYDAVKACRFTRPATRVSDFEIRHAGNIEKAAKERVYRTHPMFKSILYVRAFKCDLDREISIARSYIRGV